MKLSEYLETYGKNSLSKLEAAVFGLPNLKAGWKKRYSDHEVTDDMLNEFFEELKALSPKYCDSHNHALYFSSKNAKAVVDNIYVIKEKYWDKSNAEKVSKKRQELINQLAALDK